MDALHLARRFFGSLRPPKPKLSGEAWLRALLSATEDALFLAQPPIDRVHSIECALKARDLLGIQATGSVIAASALHDVGKTDARLGTMGRVTATVIGRVVSPRVLERWEVGSGLRQRLGIYCAHPQRGAQLLAAAGSHPTVVAWAHEHHMARDEWTLAASIAEALWQADR
jgi:hypothetical protein